MDARMPCNPPNANIALAWLQLIALPSEACWGCFSQALPRWLTSLWADIESIWMLGWMAQGLCEPLLLSWVIEGLWCSRSYMAKHKHVNNTEDMNGLVCDIENEKRAQQEYIDNGTNL
eukprot:1160393-Pelagomonas_calceolata.AAC.2